MNRGFAPTVIVAQRDQRSFGPSRIAFSHCAVEPRIRRGSNGARSLREDRINLARPENPFARSIQIWEAANDRLTPCELLSESDAEISPTGSVYSIRNRHATGQSADDFSPIAVAVNWAQTGRLLLIAGVGHSTRNRAWGNPPWVRIPPLPPISLIATVELGSSSPEL
jgi:hypothetical protein